MPNQDARPDRQLLSLARSAALQRENVRDIGGGLRVPELTTVVRAVNQLAELVTAASDEVLFGTCEPLPHSDEHRATLYAYTLACRHAGEALGHLTGALEPLGMLYRTEEQVPPARDLRDGRERAVAEVFCQLSAADQSLRQAEETLIRRAGQLTPRSAGSPSLSSALALSSSPPPAPPHSTGRAAGWGR